MTAEARVVPRNREYFGFARNVMSPSAASSIFATPLMSSPTARSPGSGSVCRAAAMSRIFIVRPPRGKSSLAEGLHARQDLLREIVLFVGIDEQDLAALVEDVVVAVFLSNLFEHVVN